jgi:hypothetical protein
MERAFRCPADRGHLHHRLLDAGLTQRRLSQSFTASSVCFGLAAILFEYGFWHIAFVLVIFNLGVILTIVFRRFTLQGAKRKNRPKLRKNIRSRRDSLSFCENISCKIAGNFLTFKAKYCWVIDAMNEMANPNLKTKNEQRMYPRLCVRRRRRVPPRNDAWFKTAGVSFQRRARAVTTVF